MTSDTPPTDFDWRAHPARERPWHAVCGLLIIAVLATGATMLGGAAFWGPIAVVILLFALNRFYFPSHFKIDATGITAAYPLSRRQADWQDLRRFVHDEYGGFLSRRARSSAFDASRGIHVLFGRHRDRVIELIRRYVPKRETA